MPKKNRDTVDTKLQKNRAVFFCTKRRIIFTHVSQPVSLMHIIKLRARWGCLFWWGCPVPVKTKRNGKRNEKEQKNEKTTKKKERKRTHAKSPLAPHHTTTIPLPYHYHTTLYPILLYHTHAHRLNIPASEIASWCMTTSGAIPCAYAWKPELTAKEDSGKKRK